MKTQDYAKKQKPVIHRNRNKLLATIPVTEHRINLAGISTAVLKGGDGSPVILLHGPGETSVWWLRIIDKLVKTHRVIIPDLPGHGESKTSLEKLNENNLNRWLKELIEQTCLTPPVLVGHLLGGSIAVRFAINSGDLLSRLVLVNSFGLGKFRPAPIFAYRLIRFMMKPTEKNYNLFMPQCLFDAENLRNEMSHLWEPFVSYNLECARDPDLKAALQLLIKKVGVPEISPEELERIDVPTTLIWGRHDRANKLKIAETASKRFGWPLHVIEKARDEPKLERPEEFLDAFYNIMSESSKENLKTG